MRLRHLFPQYQKLFGNADAVIELLSKVEMAVKAQIHIWCLGSI